VSVDISIFESEYVAARKRFLIEAQEAGAVLEQYIHPTCKAPDGSDISKRQLGSSTNQRILMPLRLLVVLAMAAAKTLRKHKPFKHKPLLLNWFRAKGQLSTNELGRTSSIGFITFKTKMIETR